MYGLCLFLCVLLLCATNTFALFVGDTCSIANGSKLGTCDEVGNCPYKLLLMQNGQYQPKDIICGWSLDKNGTQPYICCPTEIESRHLLPKVNALPPKNYNEDNVGCTINQRRRRSPTRYFVAGGTYASPRSTGYMALIGAKVGAHHDWFCDGVLINKRWILTAAHCLLRTPDVIRIGEYDTNTSEGDFFDFPIDYGVKQIKIYPEYNFPEAYHDLALIEISRPLSPDHVLVTPICLPWSDSNELPDLVGQRVTLTGWGSTVYGGARSPVLQEVDITIFDTEVCRKSYSTLHDFQKSWPRGMTSENTICAGDEAAGKDACKGDSGGPIVYLGWYTERYLAGIVSKGFGCGLKDFPGIYTPIHNVEHLSWIKETAF